MRLLLAFVAGWGCHHATPAPAAAPDRPRAPAPPREGRQVVTDTQIEIYDRVAFVGLTDVLTDTSRDVLDAIASTLDGNPSILLVEVVAYGDDGAPEWQQVIGARRAQAIVDYLVKHGVARERLRARGVAQSPPGHHGRPQFEILRRAE